MNWTSVIIGLVLIGCSYGDISNYDENYDEHYDTKEDVMTSFGVMTHDTQEDVTNRAQENSFSDMFDLDDIDLSDYFKEINSRGVMRTLKETQGMLKALNDKDLKEKCLKNADMQAYERAKIAVDLGDDGCFRTLANIFELAAEMEIQMSTRNPEEAFKEHCQKLPIISDCKLDFAAILPCLDEQEKEVHYIVQNMEESLLQFACSEGGEHITQFFEESGQECYQDNQKRIHECFRIFTSENNSNSTKGVQLCNEFQTFSSCITSVLLWRCHEVSHPNLGHSLFKSIYDATPCANITKKNLQGDSVGSVNGGSGIHESLTLFVSLLSLLAVKLV